MKRLLLSLLLLLPLSAAAYPPHGVVLMYHRFEENRYPSTNIRIAQFTAQLDYLQENGFTFWPLRKLLQALDDGTPIPDKTVALTVDDAYKSFYEHAYPIIRERKLPLTVFVSTQAVDQHLPEYMEWKQLREMQKHGVDYANHSHGHLHLAHKKEGESREQWLARVRGDIQTAQQRLDAELGQQGRKMLAYPFGEYNSALANMISEMGYTAFGQQSGAVGIDSDRRALPRFPINEHYAPLDTFSVKVASLPLPLERQQPWEPEIQGSNPPALTLVLHEQNAVSAGQIQCFLGTGKPLSAEQKNKYSLTVKAGEKLGPGRSRYNCTAPAGKGRFYWFSQPWFNGPDPKDPAY